MLQSMGSQRDGHDLVTEKEEDINVWQFSVGYCLLWVALFKFLNFLFLGGGDTSVILLQNHSFGIGWLY